VARAVLAPGELETGSTPPAPRTTAQDDDFRLA
jgi:hypothetical protein